MARGRCVISPPDHRCNATPLQSTVYVTADLRSARYVCLEDGRWVLCSALLKVISWIRLMWTNTSFLLTHSFLSLNIYASALILPWFFPDSCTFNNGGCSHTCTSLRQWKVQCSCPVDMQLMEDGKTCQNGKLLTAIKRSKIQLKISSGFHGLRSLKE